MFGGFLNKEEYDTLNSQIKRTVVNGVDLEYLDVGNQEGEVLFFVHGLAADITFFYPNFKYFEGKYRIISLSLRGHGDSGNPDKMNFGAFSHKAFAEDVNALLDHLKIAKIHFVGNSMGGMIGMKMIGLFPERFLSLTTFGNTAKMRFPRFPVKILTLFIPLISVLVGKKMMAGLIVKRITEAPFAEAYMHKIISRNTGKAAYFARVNCVNYNYIDNLLGVEVPYLIVIGGKDKFMNKRMKSTTENSRRNPNIIIEIMKLANHCPNLDFPGDFNKILERHLNGD